MAQEKKLPQLRMIRESLADLPELVCPEGYHIRSYQPGDDAYWEELIHLSFGYEDKFQEEIATHPYFRPERVWFVFYGTTPVATAAAWYKEKGGIDSGYLHMVGAHPDHAGKGLGHAVSLAALLQMRRDGKSKAILETDDFRLSAIKTYLKLKFHPIHVHENHEERWRHVFLELNPAVPEES